MEANPAIPDRGLFESRLQHTYPLHQDSQARVDKWFKGAGLGLFIHWDHASQQGLELSWPMVGGNSVLPGKAVSPDQYHSSASTFNPVKWDSAALAKLAKSASMTYAVFTSKHHNGWASWPSKFGERNIASSPFGQSGGDILKSYVEAFQNEGIKVGVYYSLSDWGHKDYLEWKKEFEPYQFGFDSPMGSAEQWERYRTYLKNHLEEILTEYGPIDLLWFDGSWERSEENWDTADLVQHIRRLSPNTLVNDRLPAQGDYRTPEQWIPPLPLSEPWECCMTMNDSWGHVPEDKNFKSIWEIVRTLVEVVSRGGNLLLNVGPSGDGELIPQERELLEALGEWMAVNSESVIGAGPGLEPWQFYGPSTKNADNVFLHLLASPVESVVVRGVKIKRVKSIRSLSTGTELKFTKRPAINDHDLPNPEGELIISVAAEDFKGVVPVIVLEFQDEPLNSELEDI